MQKEKHDLRDRTKAFALRIVRRFLFRPSRFQLRSYLIIFRLRQLSPWRGSSRRFPSERGYDVKMGMVNGLAAAEPVILLNSETRCSQPILLRDRRFLNRDQKVTHLVRLEIQQIPCAQTLWNHQNMARCDDLIRRHEHHDMIVLKYSRHALVLAAHERSDPILRIVFAIEPGISPGRRKLASWNLLRQQRRALYEHKRAQRETDAYPSYGVKSWIHDPTMFRFGRHGDTKS